MDIFIVGPARAGTSWLQTMLAEHPDIGSPPETGLFVDFLGPVDFRWHQHRQQVHGALTNATRQNLQGMATVVTDDDMVGWMRELYSLVRRRVLDGKPGATRLLEKTPDHAMFLDVIRRTVPDAYVIVLVRDPRETARSLLEASSASWGHWAPSSIEGATDRWLRNVRPMLGAIDSDERVLLVRYEDLRAGDDELARVAKFLGLEDPTTWLKTATDAAPGARESTIIGGEVGVTDLNTYTLPAFSFHDRTEHRSLTTFETAYVEKRCASEMTRLGYSVASTKTPFGFTVRRWARLGSLRARHYVAQRRRKKARGASAT